MIKSYTAPRPGMSLMEILFVIAIMGIVGAVVGPRLYTFFSGAQVDTTKQSLANLKRILDMFHLKHGEYPDTLKDLYKKPTNEELAKNWSEPYVEEKALLDAWKHKFRYTKTPGAEHPYELYSDGPIPKGKAGSKNERIDVWKL